MAKTFKAEDKWKSLLSTSSPSWRDLTSCLCFWFEPKKKSILYKSISPLELVLKHTQDLVFRGQRKITAVHMLLREQWGRDRTWTSAWKPSSCFCVRPCGPGNVWPSCWCSPCACSWPCVERSPLCCPSSGGSVWRCLRKGPARCGEGRRTSRWTCSRTPRHRRFLLQSNKYGERKVRGNCQDSLGFFY